MILAGRRGPRDARRQTWVLLHDPVLDVLGDDSFGCVDLVPGPKDERRWVLPHAGIFLATDHHLLAATEVAAFAEDRDPSAVQRSNELIDASEDRFVLTDSALSFVEHTGVVTPAGLDETLVA